MNPTRITLESLEARYAGFCAAMHGVKDTFRGIHEADGQITGPVHE